MTILNKEFTFRVLDTQEELKEVMSLQSQIWPGETVVPDHLFRATNSGGGILIGAFDDQKMVGFVFGFVSLYKKNDEELAVKHTSYMLGVHPEYQNAGLGYQLKVAQLQFVLAQGLALITWTYDPLETRNAYLNLSKLGAVCSTYRRNEYGEMADELNAGIPSDRFDVHWWVNSKRVMQRTSTQRREKLNLSQYTSAGIIPINTTSLMNNIWVKPIQDQMNLLDDPANHPPIVLLEVPADFQGLKSADMALATEWRMYSRVLFELLLNHGYIASDLIYQKGDPSRCYYVFNYGNSNLG